MKKLLALILAMLMCLVVFASCTDPAENETEAPTTGETDPVETDPSTETDPSEDDSTATDPEDDTTETNPEADTDPGKSDLDLAKENVRTLYQNFLTNPKTGADYDLIPQVMVAGQAYTIAWAVNTDKITVTKDEETGKYLVDVEDEPLADLEYVLTATITAPDGETIELTFNLVVPKFAVNTFADYVAAEDGAAVVVEGIITGVFSKTTGSKVNGLYVQDINNEGGYYVYGLTDDPNGVLLPGMTIQIRGEKDIYSGTLEIINAAVIVLDETIKTVTPVDFTDILMNADTLKDDALVSKQALLVSITGATVLELGDNGYYYFQLGEHKTYLRISSSNNATTTAALDAIKAAHAANYLNTATVTGVISIYNGNFYLSPVSADAFSNFVEVELPDDKKIASELGFIELDEAVSTNKVIDLPTTGKNFADVTFTWAVDDTTGAATIADNKLTLVIPNTEITVKVTVTATCGEATDTKEFSITLTKPALSPDQGIELNVESLQLPSGSYIAGTATINGVGYEFTELGNYGNGIQMRIKEGRVASIWNTTAYSKPIARIELVYNSEKTTYDNTGAFKFIFGNELGAATYTTTLDTVKGTSTYTITPDAETYTFFKMQLELTYSFYWDSITIIFADGEVVTPGGGETPSPEPEPEPSGKVTTIAGALTAAEGAEVEITGTVSGFYETWSSYGNCSPYITDGNGNTILVFRTTTQVAIGDVIKVAGTVTVYSNTNQIAQGSTVTITTAHVCSEWDDATCKAPKTCTVCGKTEGEVADHNYDNGVCTVCGTAEGVELQKATIAYTGTTTGNMTGNNDAANLGVDASIFTVKGIKGSKDIFPGLNKSGQIRLYGQSKDGNSLNVSIADGYTIKSIKITFGASNKANCQISAGDTVLTTTTSSTDTVLTLDINSDSFTLKNVFDGTTQIYVISIEITYAAD